MTKAEHKERRINESSPELVAQPDTLDNTVETGSAWVVSGI